MIQIKRPKIPDVLAKNQLQWTADLINLVKKYGDYNKIPDNEKNKAVDKYKHFQITEAVIEILNGKCVFCESKIDTVDYINIEHFLPKSLYFKSTFMWNNLFPSCRKCNIPKSNIDTKLKPIVNPETENPELFFVFDNLRIEVSPTSPDKIKSLNTITTCDLNRTALSRAYSEILISFYEAEKNLEDSVKDYNALVQNAAKVKHANNMHNSIDNIKSLLQPNQQYSSFMKNITRKSNVLKKVISIINVHKYDIGLTNDYSLNI
ncbi:MAG TPA: hypothetical protein VK175_07495 [Leadbetterella sp.]|nr:hypothetical protein [Leadbetterella sp.]